MTSKREKKKMLNVFVCDKMKRTHKDMSFKMMSLTLQHFCIDDNGIPVW